MPPKATLGVRDGIAVVVGVVVGAGIFRTPSLVAGNAGGEALVLGAWFLGGVVSFIGALCYAELAGTYPHAGGDYHYLSRSFGHNVGFLFVWARMTVIQTGSIATQAFLVGDYAASLVPLGAHGPSLYAAAAVVALTAINLSGLHPGRLVQRILTGAIVLGLLFLLVVGGILAAHSSPGSAAASAPVAATGSAFGLAMVFVLLTYGGWNEAAYLSAEIKGGARGMLLTFLGGLGLVTLLYLGINLVLLRALGIEQVAASEAVMADLARLALGPTAAGLITLLVVVAALSTMNATIITGARAGYALGRDFQRLAFLGRWRDDKATPSGALLVQGGLTLLLVLLGAITQRGFVTMVEYTAPVFWAFFLLVGIALFVLRRKDRAVVRPFWVPLYPLLPVLFCAAAAYMLFASIRYTGVGGLLGLAVLGAGVPVLYLAGRGARPRPT